MRSKDVVVIYVLVFDRISALIISQTTDKDKRNWKLVLTIQVELEKKRNELTTFYEGGGSAIDGDDGR